MPAVELLNTCASVRSSAESNAAWISVQLKMIASYPKPHLFRYCFLLTNVSVFSILLAAGAALTYAQGQTSPPAKPEPDVLIFTNGDKLTGQLENSTGNSATFKADMAGEVTVDWSKIKELHTNRQFAVVPKNVKIKRHESPDKIPQGNIELSDQKIQVTPKSGTPQQTVPTTDVDRVIDESNFQKIVTENPSFVQDWTGTLTLGSTLVEATQKNNTFSGGVSLVRAVPSEDWLDPRNRTTFDFNAAYGQLSQPATPTIKTDLWHLDFERDEYISSRVYVFGGLAYDHNFSQGLDLQQNYGGGIGWTAVKTANEELDLKTSVNYIEQRFADAGQDQNLIGSVFGEKYTRGFAHGITFTEAGSITPAWNNTNAYSATAQAGLTFPVYKGFSLSLSALDTFLNNPPVGFKKNSFQFTTAIGYAIK